jgi:hypothetical protein
MWSPSQRQLELFEDPNSPFSKYSVNEDLSQIYNGLKRAGRGVATGVLCIAAAISNMDCCKHYVPIDIKDPEQLKNEPLFNYAAQKDCECNEKWEEGDYFGAAWNRLEHFGRILQETSEISGASTVGIAGGGFIGLFVGDPKGGADYGFALVRDFANGLPGDRIHDLALHNMAALKMNKSLYYLYDTTRTDLPGQFARTISYGGSIYLVSEELVRTLDGSKGLSELDRVGNKLLGSDIISDGGDGAGAAARETTGPPF